MDATAGTGISVDGVILALFLLALTGLGTMVMVYGSGIRKDISKLFDLLQDHTDSDTERFDKTDKRVGLLAQRMTKMDRRTEDA